MGMTQALMTDHVKKKIQPLANSPVFKHSLDKFLRLTTAYTTTPNPVPGLNIFKRKNKRLLKYVQQVDDLYIFRDRKHRFIFTIEKDNQNKDTAILLDILDNDDIRKLAHTLNNLARS